MSKNIIFIEDIIELNGLSCYPEVRKDSNWICSSWIAASCQLNIDCLAEKLWLSQPADVVEENHNCSYEQKLDEYMLTDPWLLNIHLVCVT